MVNVLTIISIIFGVISAFAWLRSSVVKVSREHEVKRRQEEAKKLGKEPNLAGITLDGWDMSGTFRAQSFWSSIGAALAALSMLLQAIVQTIGML